MNNEMWNLKYDCESWIPIPYTMYSRRVATLASLMLRGLGCSSNGWSRVLPHHGRTAGTNATATPPPPSDAVAVALTQSSGSCDEKVKQNWVTQVIQWFKDSVFLYSVIWIDLVWSQWIRRAVSHEDSKAPWSSQKGLVGTSRYRGRICFFINSRWHFRTSKQAWTSEKKKNTTKSTWCLEMFQVI